MEGGQGALARGKAVPCRPLCVGCALSYRYRARRGCRWMPGVYAQPRPLQTVVRSTCLSTGRGLPLVFREEPGVSRVARVMPCPLVIWIRGTRHLPPPPLPQSQPKSCKKTAHFCQCSVSAHGPRKHVSAGNPLSTASHTFLSQAVLDCASASLQSNSRHPYNSCVCFPALSHPYQRGHLTGSSN